MNKETNMSILDKIFPSASKQEAGQQQQQQPAATTVTTNQVPEPVETPDPFETLWQNDEKEQKPQGLNFNLDPNQLAEIAGKID